MQYETLFKQGSTLKSLDILASLIGDLPDNSVEKLHDMATFARIALESKAYPQIQNVWQK